MSAVSRPYKSQPEYGPGSRPDHRGRLVARIETDPDLVWLDGVAHRIVKRQVAERALPETAAERELRIRRGTAAPVLTYTESIAVPVHKLPRRAVDNSIDQSQDLAADAAQPGERT